MKFKSIKPFLFILAFIGLSLIGISIYSIIFPGREAIEFKLNVISLLSGFSYLIFVLVVWGLFGKKR